MNNIDLKALIEKTVREALLTKEYEIVDQPNDSSLIEEYKETIVEEQTTDKTIDENGYKHDNNCTFIVDKKNYFSVKEEYKEYYKWVIEITGNKVNCHHCESSYYEDNLCTGCNKHVAEWHDIYNLHFTRHVETCKLSKDAKYKFKCDKCQPTYPCLQYKCCSFVFGPQALTQLPEEIREDAFDKYVEIKSVLEKYDNFPYNVKYIDTPISMFSIDTTLTPLFIGPHFRQALQDMVKLSQFRYNVYNDQYFGQVAYDKFTIQMFHDFKDKISHDLSVWITVK
jgi:hypothetical protein